MSDEFNSDEKKDSFLDRFFLRIFNRRKRKFECVELKKKPKKKSNVHVLNNDNVDVALSSNTVEVLSNENKKDNSSKSVVQDVAVQSNPSVVNKKEDTPKQELSIENKDDSLLISSEKPIISQDYLIDSSPVSQKKDNNEGLATNLEPDSNKEVTELILEEGIVQYFDELLKSTRYKINKLVSEYEQQKRDYDELVLQEDAINHSEKITILLDRINRIKEELDLLRKSFNLDESYKFDDNYISYLMDEYRKKFDNQFDERALEEVKTDSEYLSLLEQIHLLDKFTNELHEEVIYKIGDFKDRDKDFEDFRVSLDDNDKAFDEISYMIKNSEYMIKDLEDKVNNSKHVVERVEYVTRTVNNHLNALLFSYMMIRNNPLVPRTVKALVATQTVIAIVQRMIPITERRVRSEVVVDNYEEEILSGLKSIDDIFTLIDDTMAKVVDLRREFENKFKDYDIPEFHEALEKLDQLSKNISERRDYLSYTKKEFNEQLDKNNAKVKKLDYETYDEDNNRVDDVA